MHDTRRVVIANGLALMTKPQLADCLIEHGTVYPNRAGLLKWSKDDLVSSAADRVLEEVAFQSVTS